MTGLTPYVICQDAARAIDFYVEVFAATETMRLAEPSGKIGHAGLTIEGATLMLADEYPDHGARGPRSIGGSPVHLHLYVADADAVVARAVAAGATVVRPLADQFYGDRSGTIEDPFGHVWVVATKQEALTTDEVERRLRVVDINALSALAPLPRAPVPRPSRPPAPHAAPRWSRRLFHRSHAAKRLGIRTCHTPQRRR